MFASLASTCIRASNWCVFRRVLLAAVAWTITMVLVSNRSLAQVIPPVTTALPNAEVWVHPIDGANPTSADKEALYINDPSLKFKTLQAAIDALQRHLAAHYIVPYNPYQEGIVHALPGLYGAFGAAVSTGDVLPIRMRERVHVQGAGARQCIIRGASTILTSVANTNDVFFPTQPIVSVDPREVLVNFQASSPYRGDTDSCPRNSPAPALAACGPAVRRLQRGRDLRRLHADRWRRAGAASSRRRAAADLLSSVSN